MSLSLFLISMPVSQRAKLEIENSSQIIHIQQQTTYCKQFTITDCPRLLELVFYFPTELTLLL